MEENSQAKLMQIPKVCMHSSAESDTHYQNLRIRC